jgi:hypothetical protein
MFNNPRWFKRPSLLVWQQPVSRATLLAWTSLAPLDNAYVGSTFDLNMQIQGNPNPISAK